MCRSPKCFLQVLAFWKNKGFIVKIRNRKTDRALRLNILKYLYLFICLFIYLFYHTSFLVLYISDCQSILFLQQFMTRKLYIYTPSVRLFLAIY